MKIKAVKLHPNAILPTKSHVGDAAFDLYDPGSNSVKWEIFQNECVLTISTAISLQIPDGYYGQIQGRSSLASKCVYPIGGVIDSSYRGEIKVVLHCPVKLINTDDDSWMVPSWTPYPGDRIAQLVILPVPEVVIELVDELDMNTDRNTNGFGSTGA